MNKDLIASAAAKLQLVDLVLHEGTLARSKDIDPMMYPNKFTQQSKISVAGEEFYYSDDEGHKDNVFRNYVSFGVRAVKDLDAKSKNESSPEIYFTIEATFRIDYLLQKSLTPEEAQEFSQFNSVHNAWAFWRQFVFQTVKSGELPPINIPLMSGQIFKSRTKKKKERSVRKVRVKS